MTTDETLKRGARTLKRGLKHAMHAMQHADRETGNGRGNQNVTIRENIVVAKNLGTDGGAEHATATQTTAIRQDGGRTRETTHFATEAHEDVETP